MTLRAQTAGGGKTDMVCINVGPAGGYFASRSRPDLGSVIEVAIRPPGDKTPAVVVTGKVIYVLQSHSTRAPGFAVTWMTASSAVGADPLRMLLSRVFGISDEFLLLRHSDRDVTCDVAAVIARMTGDGPTAASDAAAAVAGGRASAPVPAAAQRPRTGSAPPPTGPVSVRAPERTGAGRAAAAVAHHSAGQAASQKPHSTGPISTPGAAPAEAAPARATAPASAPQAPAQPTPSRSAAPAVAESAPLQPAPASAPAENLRPRSAVLLPPSHAQSAAAAAAPQAAPQPRPLTAPMTAPMTAAPAAGNPPYGQAPPPGYPYEAAAYAANQGYMQGQAAYAAAQYMQALAQMNMGYLQAVQGYGQNPYGVGQMPPGFANAALMQQAHMAGMQQGYGPPGYPFAGGPMPWGNPAGWPPQPQGGPPTTSQLPGAAPADAQAGNSGAYYSAAAAVAAHAAHAAANQPARADAAAQPAVAMRSPQPAHRADAPSPDESQAIGGRSPTPSAASPVAGSVMSVDEAMKKASSRPISRPSLDPAEAVKFTGEDILTDLDSKAKRDGKGKIIAPPGWPAGVPTVVSERYRDLKAIGRGASGVVYRAIDDLLDREVVLKFLAATGMHEEVARRYFLREVRVASQLRHPNIVLIHDIGKAEGLLYYAMEFIDGHPLSRYMEPKKPMADWRFCWSVVRQIADALDYAHGQNVLHRDVKPDNVMVAKDGHVKLVDFGLARPQNDDFGDRTMLVGTPHYMSPEQLAGKPVSPSADQYALGVIVYRMLTGQLPFGDSNVFVAHLTERPRDPRTFNQAVPALAVSVLDRMLAKNPAQRYETCSEAAAALKWALVPS